MEVVATVSKKKKGTMKIILSVFSQSKLEFNGDHMQFYLRLINVLFKIKSIFFFILILSF